MSPQTESNLSENTVFANAERSGSERARVESLPFTVTVVRTEEALRQAVLIRQQAYARHMPEVARKLTIPEEMDRDPDSVILLAQSKVDGTPLGTIRLQTNDHAPLQLESAVRLPPQVQGRRLAHVSRLGIAQGHAGRVVKITLIKASFMVCEALDLDWAIVAARSPLDRQYEALLFADLFETGELVPLAHMNNVPHRIMGFEIATGQARWQAVAHPLLDFFCHTHHPDIQLDGLNRPLESGPIPLDYIADPEDLPAPVVRP